MADAPILVGVDAGTSRVRALAFATDGRVLAEVGRPTPWREPAPGEAELDAPALLDLVVELLGELASRLEKPRAVQGLAVASVGEAGVLLDARDRPLAPVLAWYDPRPAALREAVLARVPAERLAAVAGLAPEPIFGLFKLAWHAARTPEAWRSARRWLHLADWIAFGLGGAPATDPSLASRTALFDLARLAWSDELVGAAGIPEHLLPEILPSGTRIGGLSPEIARATGLPEGCAIGVGGHDHVMGMLAAGVVAPDRVLDSMGTAEALTLPLAAPRLDGGLAREGFNQGVVRVLERTVPYVLTGLMTSAAAIEWCRRLVGAGGDRAALEAAARAVPPGADGLLFLPHLRYGSPPFPDPAARGAFLGLAARSGPGELFRAVLEGVALDWQHMLELLCARLARAVPGRCLVIGGSTRNRLLLEIKASLFGRPLEVAEMAEGSALGAALVGGIAAGLWPDLAAARAGLDHEFARVEPDPDWPPAARRALLEIYADAYAAIRPLHRRLVAGGGPCWPEKSF